MQTSVTQGELARAIGVTTARISQLVADGRLDGTYSGDGRARRFDPVKAAQVLDRRLDPGQMMGNGATTRARLRDLAHGDDAERFTEQRYGSVPTSVPPAGGGAGADATEEAGPSAYEDARTRIAVEQARSLERKNREADGSLILAAEVGRITKRALAQEVSQFESLLQEASQAIADEFGIAAPEVAKVLRDLWRAHRAVRVEALAKQAAAAGMTPAEIEADF